MLEAGQLIKRYFIYMAVVLSVWVLFKPGGDGPLPFPQADKVIHAVTFAMLALGLWWRQVRLRTIAWILLSYAVSSEIIQHFFIPGRDFELLDIAADSIGFLITPAVVLRLDRRTGSLVKPENDK